MDGRFRECEYVTPSAFGRVAGIREGESSV